MKIEAEAEVIKIREAFLNASDLIIRRFDGGGVSFAFAYIDGLSDRQLLEENVIAPLLRAETLLPTADSLTTTVYYGEPIRSETDFNEIVKHVAEGDIAVFAEGASEYFWLTMRRYTLRGITEPPTSSVLKGPREGFIEDFKTNLTMLRRRMRSEKLAVHTAISGKYTETTVAVVYVEGIADPKIVEKIKERINAIDIDGIIDSSYIARFLEERPNSIFNEVGSTEKPDIFTAKLLEGRIGILVDGSPIALTVPRLLLEDFQDSFDYYSKDWRVTMLRTLRLLGALLTMLLPAMYIAFTSYSYHLLPLKFLVTVASVTSGIPFSSPIEVLLVLVLFEILNEASVRMPRFLGISLSIVGAIVLGDTAIKAGIISAPAVLVTSLSAIGLFCIPDQVGAFSILRLVFTCVSTVLGIYGILVCLVLLLVYMCGLNSYGTPYLAPFAPSLEPDLKDAFRKDTLQEMKLRPYSIPNNNRRRQSK